MIARTLLGLLLLVSVSCSDANATWALNSGGLGEISGSSFALGYTVAIAVAGTEVEVAPTTTLTKNGGCWNQPANGRLQYICPNKRLFHCGATFSARGSAGAGDQLVGVCAKNGTLDTGSYITMVVRADNNSVTPHCVLEMAKNDYMSLWISNETDTDDFTLDTLTLFCMRSG